MTSAEHRNFAINVLHVPATVYDQMQADNAARLEGREAAYAGKTEEANPFCPDESEHVMWAHGFATARTQMCALKNASWVIRNKATGAVICETFDPRKVAALNTVKYEAVPIRQHLEQLNRQTKAAK